MVGHDLFGATVPFHQFLKEFQCCSFVSAFGDNGFQHLALVINNPPQIVSPAIHLHKDLVDVPFPFRVCLQLLNSLLSDLGGKHRAEPVPPISDGFVAHLNSPFVQQVFDIPKRQWEPNVQHDCQTNDLWTGLEVLEWRLFDHARRLREHPARLNPSSSDKTLPTPRLCGFRRDCLLPGKADDLGTDFKIFERGRSGHGQKLRNTPTLLKQSSSDNFKPAFSKSSIAFLLSYKRS